MSDGDRIVIVGAGVAGLRAAERLRELGFDGEVVLIGDEARRPYHRPTVSKQLVQGIARPGDVTLQSYVDLDVHWRLGTRATHLDTAQRVVHLPGGEELWYDGLVVATGVVPRHLPGSPRHDPRVRVLRTVEDAAAVRRALATSSKPAVVIGGGLIGNEFAASMRQMGRDVTLVGHARAPLYRFGPRVAESVTDLHRSHRAALAMRTEVRHWITTKDTFGLHLTNNQLVVASCVVLAIGSVPAVDWLRGSGLTLDDGVLCEPTLFAVGADDVVVAGDVARWPNLRFDDVPRRVEHWLNAVESGRAAAENLLAGRAGARPFTPLPRAWSSLYEVRLQMAGLPALADDTVPLADGITGFVRAGELVGVCGWDRPRAMLRWTAELERRLPAPEHTGTSVPAAGVPLVPDTVPETVP
ncbi:pyridine nucleotide-disulfide oxidoreductase [Prauserella shujinwangii]|uniref:Pyridine nucleotide-disulfide oxidoreductase n=1 Tax=Prauserella shujinwangii TaxID=1453103 RepID=A0A2T0M3F7_9PSEU|nr:FAD-dependent oxidoreductase [Prauserella shujinwangii]PRX51291.1 pyridine nucleotide-disulfide oxidoreductase [Prauserella shujinwangii]